VFLLLDKISNAPIGPGCQSFLSNILIFLREKSDFAQTEQEFELPARACQDSGHNTAGISGDKGTSMTRANGHEYRLTPQNPALSRNKIEAPRIKP
jgi:hypothetical protein